MNLPKTETWYTWKFFSEEDQRLIAPWCDPVLYEYAFDFVFETPELAVECLETWGAMQEAFEEGWILVKETLEPVLNQPVIPH